MPEASPSGGALGINASNSRKSDFAGSGLGSGSGSSREQLARAERFRARSFLHDFSQFDRVRKCGRVTIAPHGHVGVRQIDSMVGFAGLSTCGSVWMCPACNSKIMVTRRLEIAIALLAGEQLGTIAFTAWTLRHDKSQRLDDLMKALSYCWDRVTRDKTVKKLRDDYGRYGYIRSTEITYGRHGWHPHIHPLVFFKGKVSQAKLDSLFMEEFRAYRSAAVSRGLQAPQLTAHENKYMIVDNTLETMADYLSKTSYDSWRIEFEMTATQSKESISGRTPWEILADIQRTGDYDDLSLWWEYERATRGKKQLLWGRGIKKLFDIGNQSDEQIAEEEVGSKDDTVFYITRNGWKTVLQKQLPADILNVLQSHGSTACIDFCRSQGVEVVFELPNS